MENVGSLLHYGLYTIGRNMSTPNYRNDFRRNCLSFNDLFRLLVEIPDEYVVSNLCIASSAAALFVSTLHCFAARSLCAHNLYLVQPE